MKVAITDHTFDDVSVEESILRPLGFEVSSRKLKGDADSLKRLVLDADAVITQFETLSRPVIEGMPKARVIVRYGIGTDNVDLPAARDHGIPVCNVPDYCIDEVSEHTLAFILALMRQVVPNTVHLREGKWGLGVPLGGMRTLKRSTVGIVGYGRIGREVAARLQPFGCRILIHDPVVDASTIASRGFTAADFPTLLNQSDVITLHCPSTDQTRGLINAAALSSMKPGVVLVNLSRGDLVDASALTAALSRGHVAGAGLDVFDPEPIPTDHPIRSMPNVILSAHIASASVPAVDRLRRTAATLAAQALAGELPPNVVNNVTRPRSL